MWLPPGAESQPQCRQQAADVRAQRIGMIPYVPWEPGASNDDTEGSVDRLLKAVPPVVVGCVDVHLCHNH
jgi:hypothetical protein